MVPRRSGHDAVRGDLPDPEADHRQSVDRHQRAGPVVSSGARREAPAVIGVAGAGTMGSGIAQLGCVAGLTTLLHDPDAGALERGIG
ncbi:MAG: 3-hydroxyacyl-CoA dehydrogenase NAD-binding domain-containing protein, partial [Solirubrobacteraceae bacterium]